MRYICLFSCFPLSAMAHPGHLTDLAGHDHWVAGAAIGIAVGLGLWQAAKGRRGKPETEQDPETGEEQKA